MLKFWGRACSGHDMPNRTEGCDAPHKANSIFWTSPAHTFTLEVRSWPVDIFPCAPAILTVTRKLRSIMKNIALLLAVLSLAVASQATAPSTPPANQGIRYTILIAGNKAGFETSSLDADGRWQLHYEYNDRGRGPATTERIELDKSGLPTSIENTGVDYHKAPVSEHFSLHDGAASWKNRAEQEQKTLTAPAFYVSISGAPEENAILARALLATPGGKLPLLPAGEASIEKRGELKIEMAGKSRTVVQYAITGLDFVPAPIWLDPDGTFFAAASS